LWPPPPDAPWPLEALLAAEEVLVPDETAAVDDDTELLGADMAPEYPLDVCAIPL
jgi:hypothetical protein